MSKSSSPENAEERSTSKSADSLTIASNLIFDKSNGLDIGPNSDSAHQTGNLDSVVSPKTEPSAAQPAGPPVSASQGQLQSNQGSQALLTQPVPGHPVPQSQAAQPINHVTSEVQSAGFGAHNLQHAGAPRAPLPAGAPNGFIQGDMLRPPLGGQPQRPKMMGHQSMPLSHGLGHPVSQAHQPVGAQLLQHQGPHQPTVQNGLSGGRQVSINEVQKVQTYIEKCLQLYLSQKEVVSQLEQQCQIEPAFTQLVWQKLEEQNQEFFRAYYTRLKLKDQIVLFNHLLDEQVKISQRVPPKGHVLPAAGPLLQPVTSLPTHTNHAYPQQRLGVPAQAPSSQPAPLTSAPPQPMQNHYPAANPPAHQSGAQAAPVASQAEFSNMPGLETGAADAELGANGGNSLPYVGSGLDLANMAMHGIGQGLMGGQDHDLIGIPRNFSLTDLGLDHDHGTMNRNMSFPDFPQLDADLS